MVNDATQTSELSKYQLISQPKLDKFHLLAKTCHVSNMMQDLVEATRTATTKVV